MANFTGRHYDVAHFRVVPDSAVGRLSSFDPLSDKTPPVVTFVSPSPGATISANQALVAEATDETSLAKVFVFVEFLDGVYEVVHDGTKFAPQYASSSSRVAITNGYRFSIRRNGGWPSAVTLRIVPLDGRGQEA